MRPIDADALLKGKDDHEMISTHLIFNAPTLKVIKADVIDEIRDELQKLADDEWNQNVGNYAQGMEDAIEIIDEHISRKRG